MKLPWKGTGIIVVFLLVLSVDEFCLCSIYWNQIVGFDIPFH